MRPISTSDVQDIFSAPRVADRLQRIADLVTLQINGGGFSYTSLFARGEPLLTSALEFLDGVVRGKKAEAVYGLAPVPARDLGPRLLVAASPENPDATRAPYGRIFHPCDLWVPVPGEIHPRRTRSTKDWGPFAWVPDAPGERTARMILFRSGWPHRVNAAGYLDLVVEWAWLDHAVRFGGDSVWGHGVEALHASILGRPGFHEVLERGPYGQPPVSVPLTTVSGTVTEKEGQ